MVSGDPRIQKSLVKKAPLSEEKCHNIRRRGEIYVSFAAPLGLCFLAIASEAGVSYTGTEYG